MKKQREGVYGCIVYTLYCCMSVYAVYAVYAVYRDRGRGTVRACCIRLYITFTAEIHRLFIQQTIQLLGCCICPTARPHMGPDEGKLATKACPASASKGRS